MALSANALTLVATVRDELGIEGMGKDAVLERLINAASDAIKAYCCRDFERATVTSERMRGYARQRAMLERTPVVSVTSIVYGGATLDASGYYLESADAGILFRPAGWDWTASEGDGLVVQDKQPGTEEGLYLVTYVGGYQTPAQGGTRTLPYDIEQACLDVVVALWRSRGARVLLEQKTDVETTQGLGLGPVLPKSAQQLLFPYRRLV